MPKHLFAKVSSKGQITIPTNIRNKLDLKSGSRIEFILQDNVALMMPINRKLSDLNGFLPKPKQSLSIEQINDTIKRKYDRN
jgi:AbrB family looped-hinge helix DNA binding protein